MPFPHAITVSQAPGRLDRAGIALLGNVLLVGAWLWLSRHTLAWLVRSFASPDSRTNGILLAGALLVLLLRARGTVDLRRLPFHEPRARLVPLTLLVLCAVGQFYKPRLLDSNLLASMGFALGSHALAGLYLSREKWRRGWVLVGFAMALLPFGPHLDAFLGFPARITTAQFVQGVLRGAGVLVQSAEAILIFENGVASIDLPCSGVKGLWVGGIFFLALTWIDERALGRRWLLTGGLFLVALIVANFTRVLLLVVIGFVCGQPALARLVHLPLGVFGFVASCTLAVILVRRLPEHGRNDLAYAAPPLRSGVFLLAGLLLFLGAKTPPGRKDAPALNSEEIQFPLPWTVDPLPFDAKEALLFQRHDGHGAGKWRFRVGQTRGSLLVLVADSFRAHHAPEVCLASSGHRIDGIRREDLGDRRPIKFIDIDQHRASAATWFQSSRNTTDSLMGRTLAEFLDGEQRWALVSVLFDQPTTLESSSVLLRQLHAAVGASLVGGQRKGL